MFYIAMSRKFGGTFSIFHGSLFSFQGQIRWFWFLCASILAAASNKILKNSQEAIENPSHFHNLPLQYLVYLSVTQISKYFKIKRQS